MQIGQVFHSIDGLRQGTVHWGGGWEDLVFGRVRYSLCWHVIVQRLSIESRVLHVNYGYTAYS